jgi:hypothetical protein
MLYTRHYQPGCYLFNHQREEVIPLKIKTNLKAGGVQRNGG